MLRGKIFLEEKLKEIKRNKENRYFIEKVIIDNYKSISKTRKYLNEYLAVLEFRYQECDYLKNTSLLDGISFMLSTFVDFMTGKKRSGKFDINDVHCKESEVHILLSSKLGSSWGLWVKEAVISTSNKIKTYSFGIHRNTEKFMGVKQIAFNLLHNHQKWSEGKSENFEIFPLIVYYKKDRFQKKYKKTRELVPNSRVRGYDQCLSSPSFDFFLNWFKGRYFNIIGDELEEGGDNLSFTDHNMEIRLFSDTLKKIIFPWFDFESIEWDHKEDNVVFVKNKNRVSFDTIEDNTKNRIKLVSDLICRAMQLNIHFKENVFLETRGIVLIDQIDMGFETGQQSIEFLNSLRETFPLVQFITTFEKLETHEKIDIKYVVCEGSTHYFFF